MAKLTARGAEVVDQFEAGNAHYVLASDKSVLVKRRSGDKWNDYRLLAREVSAAAWEHFKELKMKYSSDMAP